MPFLPRLLVAISLLVLAPGPATARSDLVAGLGFGAERPDRSLDDFRWDTGVRASLTAFASAEQGPFAIGMALARSETFQETGLPGDPVPPRVRLVRSVMTGETRLTSVLGLELRAGVSAGRLFIRYDPSRASYDVPGLSEPIDVSYDPIDEWIVGASLALRRALGRGVLAALRIGADSFSLETAYRDGESVRHERRTFDDVRVQLELSWLVARL